MGSAHPLSSPFRGSIGLLLIEAAVGNPHVLRGLASRKEVPLHGQAIVASAWALVAATAGRVELASAARQLARSGSSSQQEAARVVLRAARRSLYLILADVDLDADADVDVADPRAGTGE